MNHIKFSMGHFACMEQPTPNPSLMCIGTVCCLNNHTEMPSYFSIHGQVCHILYKYGPMMNVIWGLGDNIDRDEAKVNIVAVDL